MICVLIPVLNESSCIKELTDSVLQKLEGEEFKVLFIDDGSTDGTLEYLQGVSASDSRVKLMSRMKWGRGCKRGKALLDGLRYSLQQSGYTLFIEMDGDLSHNPNDLMKGVELIRKGYDVVIASKYLEESKIVKRGYARTLISFINSALFRIFISRNITDYSNGYRFYNRKAAECISGYEIKNEGPIYLGEVLSIWLQNNLRVCEFPSVYSARNNGQSKVIIADIVKAWLASLRIIYQFRFSKFKNAQPTK